jgi:L-rhamnose 1-dehydrogenase
LKFERPVAKKKKRYFYFYFTKMPQTHLLSSLTAAITGGTTGIGRAIALEYLRQGCSVAINHLNLPSDAHHVDSLLAEARRIGEADPEAGRLIEVQGDVSRPETGKELVEAAVRKFGGLDVFVSNAGVCQFAEFLECALPFPLLIP